MHYYLYTDSPFFLFTASEHAWCLAGSIHSLPKFALVGVRVLVAGVHLHHCICREGSLAKTTQSNYTKVVISVRFFHTLLYMHVRRSKGYIHTRYNVILSFESRSWRISYLLAGYILPSFHQYDQLLGKFIKQQLGIQ